MKRIISYSENGNPNCVCDNGSVYIDCGKNCECCDHLSGNKTDLTKSYTKFETLSCPCSFQVIENKFGNLECELESYGVKNRVTPIKLNNHTINGKAPVAGDKWDCFDNKVCSRGNIEWDTLHVISVKESTSDRFISEINSRRSTSNCHVPKTLLNEFNKVVEDAYLDPSELNGIDINTVENTINDLPLFKSKDQATYWDLIKGNQTGEVSEYLDANSITKYIPGYYYPTKKIITSCYINSNNLLDINIRTQWKYVSYASENKKCEIAAAGGVLEIKIQGENNPIVDISVKNSSNHSLLKRKLKNITINGEYVLKLDIPPLSTGKTQEHYSIEIKPSADTSYYNRGELISTGILKYTAWQFNDPTFSFSTTASTIANTTTATTTTGSITGLANSYSSESTTHVIVVSRDSGSDNYYFAPGNLLLNDVMTRSDIIKKIIVDQTDKKELECRGQITIAESTSNRGDLEPGMTFTGKITKTKTVYKSIDLDENLKEPCDDIVVLDILTNKFELENTTSLFSGMSVVGTSGDGREFKAILESVDCGKTITLQSHHIINKGIELTFTWKDGGEVSSVVGNILNLTGCVKLPKNTEISFSKSNAPKINGSIAVDKSGVSEMTMTSTINSSYLGQDDVTYTLDVGSIISNKPNSCDQYISVAKNVDSYIDFVSCDNDYNKYSKTVTITQEPKSGTTSVVRKGEASLSHYKKYTPNTNFIGKDKINFTLSDGAQASDEKTIFITIE